MTGTPTGARTGARTGTGSGNGPAAPLRYAYGTNGLADLRLGDALTLLADLGYDGVGLTLDHMHLDPSAPDLPRRTAAVGRALERHGLEVTVETGARYVLDPRRKHHPTLLDPDPDARAARLELLLKAVRVAAELGAHALHFFSGVLPYGADPHTAWPRLADGTAALLAAAQAAGVALAVEPEPGHLLGDLAAFHRLRTTLGEPEGLGLTLDVGHCLCLEREPPHECVRAAAPWLRHVQIEDMRPGVHEHLPFGEGELDVPPVLAALREARYGGLVTVELPRHSHAGPDRARESIRHLRRAEAEAAPDTAAGADRAPRAPAPHAPAAPAPHAPAAPARDAPTPRAPAPHAADDEQSGAAPC
ncbi:sugar phosphate isomerase/epimerase [Streptomyces sp. HNM0575]|uniref:sugar phosphate isomerase/epimerase family protein n=1 Tax=Streptomyces sp. HNM0575 TaxID=2716338 RepID=UPI00145CCE68|nr:sugar phosphate isomerase/epimerase family protein [Streptomyces sp. HNM0575]NLU72899.1 sugar phosphate isomerase/epimerase [Streptomyces sp. HNM0575]